MMTDIEIMTAMESCFEKRTCTGCNVPHDCMAKSCVTTLGEETLELLRRQKQKIEELEEKIEELRASKQIECSKKSTKVRAAKKRRDKNRVLIWR